MRALVLAAVLAAGCATAPSERGTIERATSEKEQGSPAKRASDASKPVASAPEPFDEAEAARRIHVEPLGHGAELLWVDAAAATRLSDEALARALDPMMERIAHLGLARTNASAATIGLAARMPRLERLDLRSTSIGTEELARLGAHATLTKLVLVQTKLDDGAVDVLLALPALARVHVWHSGMTAAALERLRKARPKLAVDDGTTPDAQVAEREAGIVLGGAKSTATASASPSPSLAPINTSCPVSGSPASPAYSIVFEGRVIAFCCRDCPAKFWSSPATYRAKLQ